MRMNTDEIIAVLQAFKEGKDVCLGESYVTKAKGYAPHSESEMLSLIAGGAVLIVARGPRSIWCPTFNNGPAAIALTYNSQEDCDNHYKNDKTSGYTGAVEFQEVMTYHIR